ncbi:hypothetical protein [Mesonia sp.]|uniref:hypothetical protein n=1 Tax=Mesonia sp. TaxID=1960830 RepID=UPI0017759E41|nr:hypothetical protein [Mesonia sp.]HIB37298.1 hypothetical protein [Mesonia sp.]HIO27224.1 hypothetical protein [Flavobacteriaceae bacterium]
MVQVEKTSLIQKIRAIQALSELNIDLIVEPSEEEKYKLLRQYFEMQYEIGDSQKLINTKEFLKIDHSLPSTSLFTIEKPLIFPKSILFNLKEKWNLEKKNINYSFCGLITPKRKKTLELWIEKSQSKKISLPNSKKLIIKIKKRIFSYLNLQRFLINKYGNLHIWSSNRGRIFPVKSWDKNYYNFLLSSKFVLCPSGDYIWTYRFFEAIMCGAIPIVEESCPSYNGFKYYNMTDNLNDLKCNKEIIEFNYKLCIERLTLSKREAQTITAKIKELSTN